MELSYVRKEWFLTRRPYHKLTPYDQFYLKICRDLYRIIRRAIGNHEYSNSDSRELAFRITAYFEDVVNGIGLWQAVVDHFKDVYGKRIPFFSSEQLAEWEEEYDDINPADIHFLIYQYFAVLHREQYRVSYVDVLCIDMLRDEIVDYLDAIEEVRLTDFYTTFLRVPDDFFELKDVLSWLVYDSYLFGHEFSARLANVEEELLEDADPSMLERINMLRYAEKDRLMFTVPSALGALHPLDVWAGMLTDRPGDRALLLGLKEQVYGVFEIEGETDTHYQFRHTYTCERYQVAKHSFGGVYEAKYAQTKLVNFRGEYLITGLIFDPFDSTKSVDIRAYNERYQYQFLRHHGGFRTQLAESLKLQYDSAIEFFGTPWNVFPSKKAFAERMDLFLKWQYQRAKKKNPRLNEEPGTFPMTTDEEESSVLYFVSEDWTAEVIYSPEEVDACVARFNTVYEYFYSDLLTRGFATTRLLRYLFKHRRIDQKRQKGADFGWLGDALDFEALLHIYFPEEFSTYLPPRMTFKGFEVDR